MCECFNKIGETAGDGLSRPGLHNHMDEMVQTAWRDRSVHGDDRSQSFHSRPHTAHPTLADGDVVKTIDKHKSRLICWIQGPKKAGTNIHRYCLLTITADGAIDFPGCHRLARSDQLSRRAVACARSGRPLRGSAEEELRRCQEYIVTKLESIYVEFGKEKAGARLP